MDRRIRLTHLIKIVLINGEKISIPVYENEDLKGILNNLSLSIKQELVIVAGTADYIPSRSVVRFSVEVV